MESQFQTGMLDDSSQWEVPVLEAINGGRPLLIQTDGTIHALPSHKNLLELELGSDDLYVVGPHGEIVPAIALAIKQKLLEAGEIDFRHIDAHSDNASDVVDDSLKRHFFDHETQLRVKSFLSTEDPFIAQVFFGNLVDYTEGDIETFISALGPFFSSISACIRPEQIYCAYTYDEERTFDSWGEIKTVPITNYRGNIGFLQCRNNSSGLRSITHKEQRFSSEVISIDADFCGVNREWENKKFTDMHFPQLLFDLLDALQIYIFRAKRTKKLGLREPNRLWTLSVDENWCYRREDFLIRFLRDFYLKLIKAR